MTPEQRTFFENECPNWMRLRAYATIGGQVCQMWLGYAHDGQVLISVVSPLPSKTKRGFYARLREFLVLLGLPKPTCFSAIGFAYTFPPNWVLQTPSVTFLP